MRVKMRVKCNLWTQNLILFRKLEIQPNLFYNIPLKPRKTP